MNITKEEHSLMVQFKYRILPLVIKEASFIEMKLYMNVLCKDISIEDVKPFFKLQTLQSAKTIETLSFIV